MHNDETRGMTIDQQISFYEDRINSLEQSRNSDHIDTERLREDINIAYQQVALLKIRKMMDITA